MTADWFQQKRDAVAREVGAIHDIEPIEAALREAYAKGAMPDDQDRMQELNIIAGALRGRFFECGGVMGEMSDNEAIDIAMALQRGGLRLTKTATPPPPIDLDHAHR